jgi:hypothetical protein
LGQVQKLNGEMNMAKTAKVVPIRGSSQLDFINQLADALGAGKPYDGLRVTPEDIRYLRELVDQKGMRGAAEFARVSPGSLATAMAGFAHTMKPQTIAKLQKFLARHQK